VREGEAQEVGILMKYGITRQHNGSWKGLWSQRRLVPSRETSSPRHSSGDASGLDRFALRCFSGE